MDIKQLKDRLRHFARERDWEQFHSPKNLSMALAVERGELLERFLWLTDEQSHAIRERPDDYAGVVEKDADVLIYLVRLADLLEIDLDAAVAHKISRNEAKYPDDLSYGSAVKHNPRATGTNGASPRPNQASTSDD
jgi:NTP pyrophosphatase (non-canonical NTP hydrolase)